MRRDLITTSIILGCFGLVLGAMGLLMDGSNPIQSKVWLVSVLFGLITILSIAYIGYILKRKKGSNWTKVNETNNVLISKAAIIGASSGASLIAGIAYLTSISMDLLNAALFGFVSGFTVSLSLICIFRSLVRKEF